MTFEQLLASVVGQRILSDPLLAAPWLAFAANGDTNILAATCNKAEDIPDTELATLYYALVYQKSHYDAALAVLKATPAVVQPIKGRWLLADFGAGPATMLLALARFVAAGSGEPLDVEYVHIDTSQSMRELAERYFDADDDVAGGSDFDAVRNLTAKTNFAGWTDGVDQALFAFSYIFCRPTVTRATVQLFAISVARAFAELGDRPAYILNVDALLSRTMWPTFVRYLKSRGVEVAPDHTILSYPVIYLKPDGSIRDRRDNRGKTMYTIARLRKA